MPLRKLTTNHIFLLSAMIVVILALLLTNTGSVHAKPSAKTATPKPTATKDSGDNLFDDSSNSSDTETATPEDNSATDNSQDSSSSQEDATATPDVAQEIDISGEAADVIAEIKDKGLLHTDSDGKLLFNFTPNTFIHVNSSGLTSMTVGYGKKAETFVLNIDLLWTKSGKTSGCGVGFWMNDSTHFALAVLTQDKHIALVQNQGKKQVASYEDITDLFTPGKTTTLTLISDSNDIYVYVNGQYQATVEGEAVKGGFAAISFNPKGNTIINNCKIPSGWVWTFDE